MKDKETIKIGDDKCPICGAAIYWLPGDGTQHCANHHETPAPTVIVNDDEMFKAST